MKTWACQVIVFIGDTRASYQIDSLVSMEQSEQFGYQAALKDGWMPWPLREKWWQIFRPTEYPKVVKEAVRVYIHHTERTLNVRPHHVTEEQKRHLDALKALSI